ncbi:hypothetical protein FMC13_01040 [Salmonella enterica subsp. enterica serovar Enteritidis]|nr:hypothetical protein [Salmonella enterica subsp. enterica serovar Enteritidis]
MMSDKPQVKLYKSGYTTIEYIEGIHGKKDAAYVLHYSKQNDTLFAFTVVNMKNVGSSDMARWLNIHPTDDRVQYIVTPYVEFSGNAYRFTDSEDGELFLRLYTTDIKKTRPALSLIVEETKTEYGIHFDCLPDDLIFSNKLSVSACVIAAKFANMLKVFKRQIPPSKTPREEAVVNQK